MPKPSTGSWYCLYVAAARARNAWVGIAEAAVAECISGSWTVWQKRSVPHLGRLEFTSPALNIPLMKARTLLKSPRES
jgi:hypothetical protein